MGNSCIGVSPEFALCLYGIIHLVALSGIVAVIRNKEQDFKGSLILMFLAMMFICNLLHFGGLGFTGAMTEASNGCSSITVIGW